MPLTAARARRYPTVDTSLRRSPRREANYQDSSLLRRCSRMGPGRHGDEGGGPKGRGVVGQVVRVDYPRTFLRGKDDSFNSQGLHQS